MLKNAILAIFQKVQPSLRNGSQDFFFSFVFKPLHTEMRFASFISGGFIIDIVVNQPERKLTKTHLFALSEVAGL